MPSFAVLRDHSPQFRLAVAIALVTALAATGLALYLTRGGSPRTKPVVDNISRNLKVCLVTDAPTGATAQAGWSGILDAARTGPVNAQRITAPANPTTTSALLPYVESLVQRECGLIVAAGAHLDAAVAQAAKTHPRQAFLSTGPTLGLPNVTHVGAPIAPAVTAAVRTALAHRASTTPSIGAN